MKDFHICRDPFEMRLVFSTSEVNVLRRQIRGFSMFFWNEEKAN